MLSKQLAGGHPSKYYQGQTLLHLSNLLPDTIPLSYQACKKFGEGTETFNRGLISDYVLVGEHPCNITHCFGLQEGSTEHTCIPILAIAIFNSLPASAHLKKKLCLFQCSPRLQPKLTELSHIAHHCHWTHHL